MVEIHYIHLTKLPKEEILIQKVVQTVLQEEAVKEDVDVYVTLTTNEDIHQLNREYREVDRATDVLSFPMYEREEIAQLKKGLLSNEVEKMLGDIVISIEKVKEQAEEYGHSFERELAYLVTHGMLHLLGYDHMIEEEQKVMREREEHVLGILQIGRE